MSILEKTSNLFTLYRHVCGKSAFPDVYHFWCCASAIAACLENRVWFEHVKDLPLYPNLYVLLIGPSGLGKGMAISQIMNLIDEACVTLHRYRGKATAPHLIDRMGQSRYSEDGHKTVPNPKLWLVMDELKNSLGSMHGLVEEFVSLVTDIYTASNHTIDTGTRTHGHVRLERPLLNWLAGTTEIWMRQVFSRDVFESGFVARTCFIFGDYNPNLRIETPVYPRDRDQVYDMLKLRFWALRGYQGPCGITDAASEAKTQWFHERPSPNDIMMYSTWQRQQEMLLRFAMILAVADGGPLVIQHRHIKRAIGMLAQVDRFARHLIRMTCETQDTKPINDVEFYIKQRGLADHSALLRYARSKKGHPASVVNKALACLAQEGRIDIKITETKGKVYEWIFDEG